MYAEPATKWGLLLQFSYLQLLDVLTTLVFLLHGVKEANPIVRLALNTGAPPVMVLVMVKTFAVLLALCCILRERLRLLGRVNIFFAVLVTWNLVAIILSARVFAADL